MTSHNFKQLLARVISLSSPCSSLLLLQLGLVPGLAHKAVSSAFWCPYVIMPLPAKRQLSEIFASFL